MKRETLFELEQFAERMNLMNEPFEKVWAMFNDPDRLPEPPAQVVIN